MSPSTSARSTARAFWTVAPGRGELRAEPLAAPAEGEVLVRALYSGVSRGSETLVFRGEVPESERQRMRAPFQAGELPGPVKYGYSSVGRIEQGPAALHGRTVFCLHPHQDLYVVPAEAVHPLPEDVPPARAVLAANTETALNALWDADLRIGDRLTVIGAGALGCLVAWLAGRIPGCGVELVDPNERRRAIARALGVAFATPASARAEADVIVHASGSPEGLALALRIAALESTIVELSWYGSRLVPLPLGEAFHARRLTLKSSQVGTVAGVQRARWTPRRRLALALSLLTDPAVDALVTDESPFAELPQVMQRLSAPPADAPEAADTLCHRVRYEEEP